MKKSLVLGLILPFLLGACAESTKTKLACMGLLTDRLHDLEIEKDRVVGVFVPGMGEPVQSYGELTGLAWDEHGSHAFGETNQGYVTADGAAFSDGDAVALRRNAVKARGEVCKELTDDMVQPL